MKAPQGVQVRIVSFDLIWIKGCSRLARGRLTLSHYVRRFKQIEVSLMSLGGFDLEGPPELTRGPRVFVDIASNNDAVVVTAKEFQLS